ncbi:sulfate transporter protein [Spraguea lophii 42_110]|uniref:Sulfate transporter protein n=1 Tax=Spraguea lophii (strain 42_110) TaxID=1358809 RepID=S7WB20_SPRLO|nr:sulfate transporter protein [Spraguea lophii 42_110]
MIKFNSKYLLGTISSVFLITILTLFDVLSFGSKIVSNNPEETELKNISIALFIYGNIISQLCFNIFTKINTGVISGGIAENYCFTRDIFLTCRNNTKSLEAAYTNFMMSLIIMTLLFSGFSALLNIFNLENYIKNLPEPAVVGCSIYIGYAMFYLTGYAEVDYKVYKSVIFVVTALLLTILLFLMTEYISTSTFSLPATCLAFTIVFYFIAYFMHGKNTMDVLREKKWLSEPDNTFLLPNIIFKYFKPSEISYKVIWKCSLNIISIALYSLIHISINLPTIHSRTKIDYNFSNELKTQALSNLFCSIIGQPAYTIASYSVIFIKNGGTKLTPFILCFTFILIPLIGPSFTGYVPIAMKAALPALVGLYFIIPSLISVITDCSFIEFGILCIVFLVVWRWEQPVAGLFTGVLCCFIYSYLFPKKKNTNTIEILKDKKNVKSYSKALSFLETAELTEWENSFSDEILILDLYNCNMIDWKASIVIKDIIDRNRNNIILIGRPYGFNNYDSLNQDNLHKVDNYEEMTTVIEQLKNLKI